MLATLLLIGLIVLLLAVALGGGGYVYRSYYPGPGAGGEVVEGGSPGSPAAAIALLILAIIVILFLIYGGFNLFHWFGGPANINVNVNS